MDSSTAPDAPFPGAHSQVPGNRGEPAAVPGRSMSAADATLPLEATKLETPGAAWSLKLPCRAEEVLVRKTVVVYEEVRLHKAVTREGVKVEARLKREELKVRTDKLHERH